MPCLRNRTVLGNSRLIHLEFEQKDNVIRKQSSGIDIRIYAQGHGLHFRRVGDTVVKWEYSIRTFSSVRYTLARYDEDDTLGI